MRPVRDKALPDMKPGKNNKKQPEQIEKPDAHVETDAFLDLMKNSGVKRLQPASIEKKTPPAPPADHEPINFDETFDWQTELVKPSPSQKFSGSKPTPSGKPKRRLKVTREFSPDDILDLHGETKDEALSRVQKRIRISERGNYQALLIITGKGLNSKEKGGVLGKAVWGWLEQYQVDNPIRFQWAPPFLGGKGAILVFF